MVINPELDDIQRNAVEKIIAYHDAIGIPMNQSIVDGMCDVLLGNLTPEEAIGKVIENEEDGH